MALINCPECGQQMSDTLKNCPHCGYKLPRAGKENSRNLKTLGYSLIILGLVCLVLNAIACCFLYKESQVGIEFLGIVGIGSVCLITVGCYFTKYKKYAAFAFILSNIITMCLWCVAMLMGFWQCSSLFDKFVGSNIDLQSFRNFTSSVLDYRNGHVYNVLLIWGIFSAVMAIVLLFFSQLQDKMQRIVAGIVCVSATAAIIGWGFVIKDDHEKLESRKDAKYEELKKMYPDQVNTSSSDSSDNYSADKSEDTSFLGTYVFTQPKNHRNYKTLTITVKEDKTVEAVSKGKDEKRFYGSWYKSGGYDNEPVQIRFSFNDTQVYVPRYGDYGGGYADVLVVYTDWADYIDISSGVLSEGYLYEDWQDADAKNPEKRVKLNKIK